MNEGAVRITVYLRDKAKATLVKLKGDFTGLQKHVTGAFRLMATAGSALRNVLFSAGSAAGALAFTVMIQQTLASADALAKMGRQVGVSVENLSTLEYAAGRGGVQLSELRIALQTAGKTATEASQGVGEAKGAYEALGISTKTATGEVKDSYTVLLEVADAFSKLQDGPTKSAAAMRIFGEAGTKLIPTLNEGSEGIRRLQDRARGLGLELSDQMARAAEQANDNIGDLTASGRALGIALTNLVLPSLVETTTRLANAAAKGSLLNAVWAEGVVQLTRFQQYVTGNEDGLAGLQDELDLTRTRLAELRKEQARLLNEKPIVGFRSGSEIVADRKLVLKQIRAVEQLESEQQQKFELGLARRSNQLQLDELNKRLAEEARVKAEAARKALGTLAGFSNAGPGGAAQQSPEAKQADELRRRNEEDTTAFYEQMRTLQETQRVAGEEAILRLQEQNASELELLQMRLDSELQAVGDNEEAKAALRSYYATRAQQAEARAAAVRFQTQAALGNSLVGLASAVGARTGAIEKANAIYQAVLAFNVAKAKAVAAGTPFGAPARIGLVVGLLGPVISALKGASPGAGASLGGAGGGGVAFDGGPGGGIPAAAPTVNQASQGGPGPGSVTVVVQGNLMSREWVQGELVSELREAARQGFNIGTVEVRAGRQ